MEDTSEQQAAPKRRRAVQAQTPGKQRPSASKVMDKGLNDAIPYLVARAGVRMGQAFTRELRQFELSLAEWRVCSALYHQPHQRLSDLAVNTSTEPSTLSRLVDGMMQRGLLLRDRADNDARALALSLTAEGSALAQRVNPVAQVYERVALTGFTAAQADQLREMLRRLYDNMGPLDGED